MVRQFVLHQKVRLATDNALSSKHLSPDGVYEVTRLLPEDQGGAFHYRIQSSAGELVVKESLLVVEPLGRRAAPGGGISASSDAPRI